MDIEILFNKKSGFLLINSRKISKMINAGILNLAECITATKNPTISWVVIPKSKSDNNKLPKSTEQIHIKNP